VPPKQLIYKAVRITLGILFLLLAIPSAVLPVLQAWMFVLIGLALLSYDVPFVRRMFARVEERFPEHTAWLRKKRSQLVKLWRRIVSFPQRKRAAARPEPDSRPAKNPNDSPLD